MDELKAKIEAVLFCVPQGISTAKLAELVGIGSKGRVAMVVKELAKDYETRGFSIVEEDSLWKFKIRQEYVDLVKDAAAPEMDKALLETLGYVAWKKKIMQSELCKVRSTKVYEQLAQLENMGFIEKERKGVSYLVKPTKKFYEYFDLNEEEKLELIESRNKQIGEEEGI